MLWVVIEGNRIKLSIIRGELLDKRIRGSSKDAADVYTALALRRVKTKQIEDKAMDDREIGPRIFHSSTHLVIVQRDIEMPVNPVLCAQCARTTLDSTPASGAILPM